ncbi:prolipoprotein diacylglyceryl transferase [Desulfonema magnum]|uniref:Phosphatidylglycerol--prolipoprotein diacylglyceryl transferase n=1 Tax=Desulfonema magnum TaxID=45655 RepID=A0A975GQ64_9BACT|nr:prolipoprotein diacylglyceryl transferase [Desulfonema magnum]QTA88618.1 Phosphatidylglycerol--prolipoprotein diacylglyceryl transferase [Desulfonema magnum]
MPNYQLSIINYQLSKMYPVLFKFGQIAIYTYGLFIALGFLAGISVAKKEAVRVGEDPDKMMDICFYILISAIIASRLFYVVVNLEMFLSAPLDIFKIWNGGLVFYGGFIGAAVTAFIYLKKHRMPLWKTLDILAPSLALGHFLGRIGCFFAGCCYGKVCHLPWAITFSHPDSLAPTGIPLHPTQLYSALNNLMIFGFLWLFRRRKKFDGQLCWIYVLIYGITRSVIEVFRGDDRGDFIFGVLSVSQTIGIIMAIIAIVMLIFLSKKTSSDFRN